jgi:hypothetical protein
MEKYLHSIFITSVETINLDLNLIDMMQMALMMSSKLNWELTSVEKLSADLLCKIEIAINKQEAEAY